MEGDIDQAYKVVEQLWALGYSPEDIIGNVFRVCKTYQMAEYLKLEFIKVRWSPASTRVGSQVWEFVALAVTLVMLTLQRWHEQSVQQC